MTTGDWVKTATKKLELCGIPTHRLDAELLLTDALNQDRSWLHAHPEEELQNSTVTELQDKLARRANHEPLAYIRGFQEFYGRDFLVDKNVMVPRPESETIIDLLKKLSYKLQKPHLLKVRPLTDGKNAGNVVVDVGTGSGALAITAKLEVPTTKILAIDINPECLKIARKNAKKHKVSIEFMKGDLLSPVSNLQSSISNLLILANLPYVPDNYPINEAAKHEPAIALFSGSDGLDLYRKLFAQLSKFTSDGLQVTVLAESLIFQHSGLKKIAKTAGFNQINSRDLVQVFTRQS